MKRILPSVDARARALAIRHHSFVGEHDVALDLARELVGLADPTGYFALSSLGVALIASGVADLGLTTMVSALEACVKVHGVAHIAEIAGRVAIANRYRQAHYLGDAESWAQGAVAQLANVPQGAFTKDRKTQLLLLTSHAFTALGEIRWGQRNYSENFEYTLKAFHNLCWAGQPFNLAGYFRFARSRHAAGQLEMARRMVVRMVNDPFFRAEPKLVVVPPNPPPVRKVAEAMSAVAQGKTMPHQDVIRSWNRYHTRHHYDLETNFLQLAGDIFRDLSLPKQARNFYERAFRFAEHDNNADSTEAIHKRLLEFDRSSDNTP